MEERDAEVEGRLRVPGRVRAAPTRNVATASAVRPTRASSTPRLGAAAVAFGLEPSASRYSVRPRARAALVEYDAEQRVRGRVAGSRREHAPHERLGFGRLPRAQQLHRAPEQFATSFTHVPRRSARAFLRALVGV